MGIGASIFMVCVGAIITFGVRHHYMVMDWVDLDVVGWVLMIGGFFGLVATMIMWASNRRETHVVERHHPGPPPRY